MTNILHVIQSLAIHALLVEVKEEGGDAKLLVPSVGLTRFPGAIGRQDFDEAVYHGFGADLSDSGVISLASHSNLDTAQKYLRQAEGNGRGVDRMLRKICDVDI